MTFVAASLRKTGRVFVSWMLALFLCSVVEAQDLVAKAKEEKKVVVYHTTTVPDTQKIVDGFHKKYPFLEVETYRATNEKLTQKIATEVKAGRNLADVYINASIQTSMLKGMGLISQYNSPEREKIATALKDTQGYWTGVYWNIEVLGYNTNLVPAAEVPAKWEDLLKPRWKNLIGLEEEDTFWYSSLRHLMGEEKCKEYMRRLAKQQPQIRAGHTLLTQLLAAGEFALAPTTRTQTAEQLKEKGAPVDWTAIEPLAPNPPVSVSLPKTPPHPNAAKLFIDFILSKEGQSIIYDVRRNPTRTDLSQPVARVAKIRLMERDADDLAKNYNRYTEEFREIFSIR
jgi:iron(III) transport system substrate-binding protein